MVPIQLEPGPDGEGWWPRAFAVDLPWTDQQTATWRTAIAHPTLQARRVDMVLDLTDNGGTTVHSYHLSTTADLEGDAYIAAQEE